LPERAAGAEVKRHKPERVAVVGIGAYRAALGRPKAVIGPLPQPSGLNAKHQMPELTAAFREPREAVG